MDYEALYQQKLTTADEAVKVVKSGDWVDYGWCTGTACALDKALAGRMSELEDINLRGGILMWQPAIFQIPDVEKKITWNSWHMGGVERKACTAGFGFYNALRYSELPRYYRENVKHVNVAMFQVAPMDSHGYFSFGPNASHLKAVCDVSDVVIVEVNKNMPRCLGGFEEAVHISEVDMVVEGENPPIAELGAGGAPTDVDRAVAKLIVEEIPNGACLQLGIGGMPNTVGSMIAESDLKDLGVHTEMYVDAFVDIAMAGKINGLSKGIDFFFGLGSVAYYVSLSVAALSEGSQKGSSVLKKICSMSPSMMAKYLKAKRECKRENRPLKPKDIFRLKGFLCAGTDNHCYKDDLEDLWGVRPVEVFSGTEPSCIGTETWNRNGLYFFP